MEEEVKGEPAEHIRVVEEEEEEKEAVKGEPGGHVSRVEVEVLA